MKASNLMTSPIISVHMRDSVHDVAKIFVERGISGAIVLNDSDQAVGVITKTDLVRYDRERLNLLTTEKLNKPLIADRTRESFFQVSGFHVEPEEETIETWITPKIHSICANAPLSRVTYEMFKRQIHHIFVRSHKLGKLVGVITTMDLLRYLSHRLTRHTGKGRRGRSSKRGRTK